ncbi:hypothetical protein FGO68_gene9482 [Halteria grandinella]|uniref:Uncharacterized protein n=1 Tax=Halteria grandinella TaxID=5974 RepID=A0A8J8TAD8_HALGN|nr:hypothetical protein FGO68_gene9482 [Halteria grandinella]
MKEVCGYVYLSNSIIDQDVYFNIEKITNSKENICLSLTYLTRKASVMHLGYLSQNKLIQTTRLPVSLYLHSYLYYKKTIDQTSYQSHLIIYKMQAPPFQPPYPQQQPPQLPQPPLALATQHLQGLSQSLDVLQKSLHNYDNSKYSAVQEQSAAYFNRLQALDRLLQQIPPTAQNPQNPVIPQYVQRLGGAEGIKETVQAELSEGPIYKAQVARGLQSNFRMFREEMKAISDEQGLRVAKQEDVQPLDGFLGMGDGLGLGGFDGGVSMEGFGMMMMNGGGIDISMVDQQQQMQIQ